MSTELSFKTAVCTDYENLLLACQMALETWRKLREEVVTRESMSKDEANELLRLQAAYAKGYSRLKKHQDTCELCRFVSKVGKDNFASISTLN
jgi:transcriptional antiterminator Rof (Rho-off)